MPVSVEQLAERRGNIGASDVPAILGVSRWASAADVYHRIVDGVTGDPAGEAAELGNRLEPAVLNWFEETRGVELTRQYTARYPELRLIAHIDGVYGKGHVLVPVEAKTAGFFAPLSDEWGPFDTDSAPLHVIAQVHAQMLALQQQTGKCAAFAEVPVLLKRAFSTEFGVYIVKRDAELLQLIIDRLTAFNANHIAKRVRPLDCVASADVLRRLARVPNKVVPLPEQLVADWKAANKSRLDAEKVEAEFRDKIIQALGDAEAGTTAANGAVTYYETTSRRLDTKALEAAHPEIVEQFRKETTSRSLRPVKALKA